MSFGHLLAGLSGGAAERSFSFVGSTGNTATTSASTISLPAGWTEGDLCLLWIWLRNSLSAGGIPAGFTDLGTVAVSGWGGMGARVLQAGDTTFTGPTASNSQRWITAAFRPSVPINTFSINSYNGESTAGDPVSQTITASGGTPALIAMGHMGGQTAVDPRAVAPAMDELNDHLQTNHYAHYKIYNPGSSPSDHTYNMDDETTQNNMQSGYLTFT